MKSSIGKQDEQIIFNFMEQHVAVQLHGSVRILQLLIKQTQISHMITMKNQSYQKHQRLDDHVRRKKIKVHAWYMNCLFLFCLGNGHEYLIKLLFLVNVGLTMIHIRKI
jgi:hypothetical protein